MRKGGGVKNLPFTPYKAQISKETSSKDESF